MLTLSRAPAAQILDMGCGWGSLVLFMAARYPHAQITGVSNSNSQRQYIEAKCKEQGLTNVTIVTGAAPPC